MAESLRADMVSTRRNSWAVSADEPLDSRKPDLFADQPLLRLEGMFRYHKNNSGSKILYEVFSI